MTIVKDTELAAQETAQSLYCSTLSIVDIESELKINFPGMLSLIAEHLYELEVEGVACAITQALGKRYQHTITPAEHSKIESRFKQYCVTTYPLDDTSPFLTLGALRNQRDELTSGALDSLLKEQFWLTDPESQTVILSIMEPKYRNVG